MTWLYIPPSLCVAPPSAPAEAGWNSASISPCPDIGLWCTSSGRPTRRPLSWRGWRTRPWIKLLSGTMLEPSTAARGVERWISSLRDIPASPSARLAVDREPRIPAISGPISAVSSSRAAPGSFSSKTCPGISRSGIPLCAASWKRWVSELRKDCSARRKSVRTIADSACLSWPTSTATDAKERTYQGKGAFLCLPGAVRQWPLWPTAEAANARSGLQMKDGKRGLSLCTVSKQWPTALGRDWKAPPSTPMHLRRKDRPTVGDHLASYAVHRWPEEGCLSSLLDLLTTLHGWTSSPSTRRLSPRFVELLMGWPIGWTDCGSAVTEWSRWLLRSRSALSWLVLRSA